MKQSVQNHVADGSTNPLPDLILRVGQFWGRHYDSKHTEKNQRLALAVTATLRPGRGHLLDYIISIAPYSLQHVNLSMELQPINEQNMQIRRRGPPSNVKRLLGSTATKLYSYCTMH